MKRLIIIPLLFFILLITNINLQAQFSSQRISIKPAWGLSYSSVAWADYDRDGDLDLAVAGQETSGARRCRIYKNNGNGTFATNTIEMNQVGWGIGWGVYQGDIAWVDYNNDKYPDLLVTGIENSGQRVCYLFRNLKNGKMADTYTSIVPGWGVEFSSVNIADYDNDEYPDIAVAGNDGSGTRFRIFRNNHVDGFAASYVEPKPGWGFYNGDLVSADFDNDGDIDIIAAGNDGAARMRIYYNNGNGTFLTNTYNFEYNWGFQYCSMVKGDFDNDGDNDVIIGGSDNNSIKKLYLYKNMGNGRFHQDETDIGLEWGVDYCSLDTADYDLDGDLDLIVTGYDSSSVAVLRVYYNNGQGIFGQYQNLSSNFGVYYSAVSSADYDNDGDNDLIVTGFNNVNASNYCSLYKNLTDKPKEKIAKNNEVRLLPNYIREDSEYTMIYFEKDGAPDEEFDVVITTLTGALVKDLGKFTSAQLEQGIQWSLVNENDKKVRTGIYFVAVPGKNDKAVKKLYISR